MQYIAGQNQLVENPISDEYGKNRLLDRLDDLRFRMDDLVSSSSGVGKRNYLSDFDLKYSLPEHIETTRGVERAMDLAKEELNRKHGVLILEGDDLVDAESQIRKALGLPELGNTEYESNERSAA